MSTQKKVTWKCVDTTSYDRNLDNDSKRTSIEGETRYDSDSGSKKLDPTYMPGAKGDYRK